MTFITPKTAYIPGKTILRKMRKIVMGIATSKERRSEAVMGNEMGHEMKSKAPRMSIII